MARKFYGEQQFHCTVKGATPQEDRRYSFYCKSQDTSYGFRHVCYDNRFNQVAKVCYYNRTWERFRYETVLTQAIEKSVPKADQQAVKDILIEKKAEADHAKAEADIKAFAEVWGKTSDKTKDMVRKALPNGIQTTAQAEFIKDTLPLFDALNKIL